MRKATAVFASLSILVTSCAFSQDQFRGDAMYVKAAELLNLSKSVEATVRFKNPSSTLTDEELLKLATAHSPGLLAPFVEFDLRVNRSERRAVILMCAPTGVALLEDAACTGKLDVHHWESDTPRPCEFTIRAAEIC